MNDMLKLVQELSAELEKALAGGKPTIFLGYSFGSVLAFECARVMQKKGCGPLAVFVTSAEGPSWDGRAKMGLAKMNEADFEKMLWDKGGTEFILKEPSMKAMFVPVIKNDVILEENYRYKPSPKLKCPIVALYGA